ncbi:MAG: tRNA threonylcarbamoyladenosine dehydratase [Candidatus Limivicinus sp.]|jgi:tRNA A37 threonylcarbamoyladenosine dehydratase
MDERLIREEILLGGEALAKLKGSHVAVFGLGGVGSWCAEALARAGVGELTIVDEDTVSVSNINRQLCALESTVGQNKADVIAGRLMDINSNLRLHSIVGCYRAEDRERFLGDYDFVADAIDTVSSKLDLILSCRERHIPIISSMGTGNKRDASKLELTDISKTCGCPLARVMRRELRARGVVHQPVVFSPEAPMQPARFEAPPPGRHSVPGSLVWVPASAGLLMCQYIVTSLIEEK